jgi:hypothetical protein
MSRCIVHDDSRLSHHHPPGSRPVQLRERHRKRGMTHKNQSLLQPRTSGLATAYNLGAPGLNIEFSSILSKSQLVWQQAVLGHYSLLHTVLENIRGVEYYGETMEWSRRKHGLSCMANGRQSGVNNLHPNAFVYNTADT